MERKGKAFPSTTSGSSLIVSSSSVAILPFLPVVGYRTGVHNLSESKRALFPNIEAVRVAMVTAIDDTQTSCFRPFDSFLHNKTRDSGANV